MNALNPTPNLGVQAEAPIAAPRAVDMMGAVSGLLNTAIVGSTPPKAASGGSRLAADKNRFYMDLDRATQLKEQGKVTQANNITTKAYREFARQWGREEEDVNNAFSDATGFSFDAAVTGSTVRESDFVNTVEFNVAAAAISAENPELAEDEVFGLALERTEQQFITDAAIKEIETQKKVKWFEAEEVYVQKAKQAGATMTDMLKAAEVDSIITPDEAKQIRSFYREKFGGLTKPEGVSQAEWADYKSNYIDTTTTIVESTIGLAGQQGISQDTNRAVQSIIAKAVAQGKFSPFIMSKLTQDSDGSYASFQTILLEEAKSGGEFTKNYNFAVTATLDELVGWVTEFENKTDLDQLRVGPEEFSKLPDAEKSTTIQAAAKMYSSDPAKVAVDIVNVNSMVESLDTRALSAQDFKNVFTPEYYNGLNKVYEKNPVIGRQLIEDSYRVVNSQQTAIAQAIDSRAKQHGLFLQGGKLLADPTRTDPRAQALVDEVYGGDWNAAIRSSSAGGRLPSSIREGRTLDEEAMAAIAPIMTDLRTKLMPMVNKLNEASSVIEQLQKTLPKEEQERNARVSSRGDVPSTMPSEANSLVSLIDEREGGGDYNTLLDFSNREGGAFAGVSLTDMTLGELSDFSQGEYADFSLKWKRDNNHGDTSVPSTPMGRYQIVGATLRQTMKEMGLPRNTLFTKNVQDAMFHHLATKAIKGKEGVVAKRKALQGVWEGFKPGKGEDVEAFNNRLDAAIAQFEGSPPPSLATLQSRDGNMQTAPSESARPRQRPQVDVDPVDTAGIGDTRPQARPNTPTTAPESASEAPQGTTGSEGTTASQKVAQEDVAKLSKSSMNILARLGIAPESLLKFDSKAEAQESLASGDSDVGDVVYINGELVVL